MQEWHILKLTITRSHNKLTVSSADVLIVVFQHKIALGTGYSNLQSSDFPNCFINTIFAQLLKKELIPFLRWDIPVVFNEQQYINIYNTQTKHNSLLINYY
jgi:hypothetical protein